MTSFVNSPLVSASVDNISVLLESSTVKLQFKTRLSGSQFNLTNVRCMFWNDSTSRVIGSTWDRAGTFPLHIRGFY